MRKLGLYFVAICSHPYHCIAARLDADFPRAGSRPQHCRDKDCYGHGKHPAGRSALCLQLKKLMEPK